MGSLQNSFIPNSGFQFLCFGTCLLIPNSGLQFQKLFIHLNTGFNLPRLRPPHLSITHNGVSLPNLFIPNTEFQFPYFGTRIFNTRLQFPRFGTRLYILNTGFILPWFRSSHLFITCNGMSFQKFIIPNIGFQFLFWNYLIHKH